MRNLTIALVAVAAVALLAGSANAEVININFASTLHPFGADISGEGKGPITYTGETWNNKHVAGGGYGTETMDNLVDSGNTATTIDLSIGRGSEYASTRNLDVVQDYIMSDDGWAESKLFTFSDLDTSKSYNLAFMSAGGSGITIDSVTKTITGGDPTEYQVGVNYVTFTGVPGTTGTITGSYGPGSLGGIQIEVVPEPATLALLGLGGIGLLLRRRRRS